MMNPSSYSILEVNEDSYQYVQTNRYTHTSSYQGCDSLFDVIDRQSWVENSPSSTQESLEAMMYEKTDSESVSNLMPASQLNQSTQNTLPSMMNIEGDGSKSGETTPALEKKSTRERTTKDKMSIPNKNKKSNKNCKNQKKQNCQFKNFPLFLASMLKGVQRRFKKTQGKISQPSDLYFKFSSFYWEGLKASRSLHNIKFYLISQNPTEEAQLLNLFNNFLSIEKTPIVTIDKLRQLQKVAVKQILKQEDNLIKEAGTRKLSQTKLQYFVRYVTNFIEDLKDGKIKLYNKFNDL